MNNCKYIIFDDFNPILFHCGLTHKEVADKFLDKYEAPTSAGFVQIIVKRPIFDTKYPIFNIHVYGESISLKLKSKFEDAKIIDRMFGKDEI